VLRGISVVLLRKDISEWLQALETGAFAPQLSSARIRVEQSNYGTSTKLSAFAICTNPLAQEFHKSPHPPSRPSANCKSTRKAKEENKSGYDFTHNWTENGVR
jgi:hypothetical protein